MLGDTVEAALNKMMITDQHQHSDGLLQEFYVMTQGANEPIAVRVAHTSEAFSGRFFKCNKVRHHFCDEECEMYNPDFLNSGKGPTKTSLN